MNSLKIFSFFSGSGFLDLGFELSGFSIELVNEFSSAFIGAYKYSRAKMGLSKYCVLEVRITSTKRLQIKPQEESWKRLSSFVIENINGRRTSNIPTQGKKN